MKQTIFFTLIAITIPLHAMEKTDIQHQRKVLIEHLTDKPQPFLMWTPEDNGCQTLYQAKNSSDLNTIVNHCNPTTRIHEKYSVLGVIALSPQIPRADKKEIIQKLLNKGFTPTLDDQQLAFLEAQESYEKKSLL